jgi:chromate reductase
MAGHLHLRQVLYAVNLATMPYPEAYIPGAGTLFDDKGQLIASDTREFLGIFMRSFEAWIDRLRAA